MCVYARDKFMQIRQNEPLDIFMWFLLCVLAFYALYEIKIYAVQIYVTGTWLT